MQGFRRFLRGPAGKVLLAVIILPFVVSAFYGYFTGGGGDSVVAKVEGVSVTRNAVDSRVQQVRRNVSQQSPDIDPDVLNNFINAGMILEGMISELLMLHTARDSGMRVSEEQAARAITRTPDFQDPETGRFSQQVFERVVRSMGQSPRGYIQGLGDQMLLNQLRAGYEETEFALPYELADLRRLGEQRRDISYIRVDTNTLRSEFEVSAEEAEAFYERNTDEFIRPQQFQLEYVLLDRDAYLDRVSLSEEEIRTEYQARRQMIESAAASAERRRVSHILFTGDDAEARAEAVRETLAGGGDFSAAAAEHSDDAATAGNGGDLGTVARGDLPEALEEALFALEEGAVSAPVANDGAVHLLKAVRVQRRELPGFDEMRDNIARDMKQAQADVLLGEDVAILEQLAFEHPDLQVPAETLSTTVRTSGYFPLSSPEGIATHQGVRAELNNPAVRERGQNSRLVELDEGRFVVIRVADSQPAEPIPFAEVRDRIVRRLQMRQAFDRIDEMLIQGEQAVSEGADITALASLWDRPVSVATDIERGAAEPAAELVEKAFRMPRPTEGEVAPLQIVRLGTGDLVALSLRAVRDGDPEGLDDAQQAQALAQLGQFEGERSFRQAIAWLRESGKVRLYPERLGSGEE
ncbi:SurA N-terminal domain-containing protein [Alcanivorax sp. JB21]|uniref:SurA N-terminal domain-containing protein n=1 Tax=Alcanivorax limicola TaxID=2874102 RepID=UPI001CC03F02|nr:SurA N-terminal domain-containing protein [Alcanivorax limicola]MBZ2187992.1 SurA N-terminal domain-containing protein [Alcanivorax limicola]